MSRRARFSLADIDRAVKAAARHGYEVRLDFGTSMIRMLPLDPGAVPTPAAGEADSDWDKHLGIR